MKINNPDANISIKSVKAGTVLQYKGDYYLRIASIGDLSSVKLDTGEIVTFPPQTMVAVFPDASVTLY